MDDLLQSARTRLANALLGTPDATAPTPAPATSTPFVWGAGGAQLTPAQIASRQQVADAMMQQGTDSSPLPAGTRGVGIWTQGLARVAKALMGAMEQRDLDQQTAANNKRDTDLLLSNPALQGTTTPATTAATTPAPAAPTTATPAPTTPDASVPRGIRNNNPLNIEDGPFAQSQPGYVGSDGRFAKFATPDHGVAAANSLLDTYQSKYGLNTVGGIVGRWAPASDGNNVSAYATDVAHQIGIDPNAPLTAAQRPQLIAAMAQHENGVPLNLPGVPPVTLPAAAPVQVASNGPVAVPAPAAPAAAPAQGSGIARVASALAATPTAAPAAPTAPAAPAAPQIPPATAQYIRNLIQNPDTRAAGVAMLAQYQRPHDTYSQQTDKDGNVWNVDNLTGQRTVALQGTKDPTSVQEYQYYKQNFQPTAQQPTPMDYATFSTAKARAGATTVNNNYDPNAGQTYDSQLAGGLAKSHAALANGVEDAQARARDIAAMQGAIDQIQKNGGTTGGLGQAQIVDLQKTINSGAAALGMDQPFDVSNKEFLQKFNRSLAGAQAKGAMGSRVTNFEMSNYLKANPGLDMSVTGNQRLLGIQAQIEQRNIAVGNAIRAATAQAISQGKRIDPVTVQGIITNYDNTHHIKDPVTGQDLTQSYVLPEFQNGGTNAALAVGHETNINGIKIKRVQ